MTGGYFRVERAVFDHPVGGAEPYSRREAWLFIIGHASWKQPNRGEFITSQHDLARRFQWGENKLRRFLRWLSQQGMISVEGVCGERGFTRIRVTNYNRYQGVVEPSPTEGKPKEDGTTAEPSVEPSTEPSPTEANASGTAPSVNLKRNHNKRSSKAVKQLSPPIGGLFNDTGNDSASKPSVAVQQPKRPPTVDALVFEALRSGKLFTITPDDVGRAGAMLKRNGNEWSPHTLGALWYAAKQQLPVRDVVAFAVGCARGKSAARADFDGYVKRAEALLNAFRRQVEGDAQYVA
jgi:hypothetical protein